MVPRKGSPLRSCGCVAGGGCVHSLFQLERHWECGTGCQHDPHTFYWSFSLVLSVNVQIPSCGSIVLCYHSHPVPGAFGTVLLSAAPQNHTTLCTPPSMCTNMHIILGQGDVASNLLSSESAEARGSRAVYIWGLILLTKSFYKSLSPSCHKTGQDILLQRICGAKGLPALLI